MTDETHNIILDYLRDLRAAVSRLETGQKDIQAQLHTIRHNQIGQSSDALRTSEKMTDLESRIERLEKSGGFTDIQQ